MNCHEVRHQWMLYLDSEGDPQLHLRVSDHLAMCPECAEWFARQQGFERRLAEHLTEGDATPELWDRVLTRAGVHAPRRPRRRFFIGILAAAAVLLVLFSSFLFLRPHSSELGQIAANRHEQWLQGEIRPDLISTSDREVEDHLRAKVSFPIHCPPRKDVNFAVAGAGICRLNERQAAYLVGNVESAPVSILVFDRASLDAFPGDRDHIFQGNGRHHCREGKYRMVSGIVAGNLVVVIGTAPAEALEKLLNAYGSYHEG